MGRQRVTDDHITIVKSQKIQQFLARVPAFVGSHKFSLLSVSNLYAASSAAVNRQKICISQGSFWLINIHPLRVIGSTSGSICGFPLSIFSNKRRGSEVEYSASSCDLLRYNSEYPSSSNFLFNGSSLDQPRRVEAKLSLEKAVFLFLLRF